MKQEPAWPAVNRPRYCKACYRPVHDGDCERPFAFPGWKHTDCPTWPPAKPVDTIRPAGGVL